MGRYRNIGLSVLLVAVILAGIGLAMRAVRFGKPRPPKFVTGQPIEMIDRTTLEVIALPRSEWDKLGVRNGSYRNPKTGEYTMAPVVVCASCGAKVPVPEFPAATPDEQVDYLPILRAYRCPKCGGKVYDLP